MSYIGNQITGFLGTGSLTVTTSTVAVEGDALFSADGNVVIGDASGDTITINAATASIPNNLNIDSNTLFLDASNNRVGIGSANPATALDVAGTITSDGLRVDGEIAVNTAIKSWDASTDAVQFQSGSLWNYSTSQLNLDQNVYYNGAYKYLNTGAASEYSQASGAHFFKVASSGSADADISFTTALTVANSGNVGIGTSSPDKALTISASDSQIRLYDADGTNQFASFQSDNGTTKITSRNNTSNGTIAFQKFDGTTVSESMRIDSSGRVGIGTSSPAKDLHIKTTTTNNQVRLEASAGNINIGNDSTGSFIETTGSRPFRGFVGGSERMRIDDNGLLLIGTTDTSPYNNSAGSSADNGVVVSAGRIWAARYSGTPMDLNRTSDDGTLIDFRRDGSVVGSVYTNAADGGSSPELCFASGNTGLKFDDTNNYIRPTNSAGAHRDNTVSLGTANSRFKNFHLNGGIYFGSRSNALDDYEEGTWTPTAGTNVAAISNAEGFYTKIGRLVTVNFYVNLDPSSTSTGMVIGGLPFGVATGLSGTNVEYTGVCFEDSSLFILFAFGATSSIQIELDRPIQGSANAGAANYRGSVTYMTA